MISTMVLIENKAEKESTLKALDALKLHCIITEPSYSNYVKALQYMPDIIIMEIPRKASKQFHFIQMFKQHHIARSIPIIAFGDSIDENAKSGMEKVGITRYFERPNNLAAMLEYLKQQIKLKEKTGSAPASAKQTISQAEIAIILSPKIAPAIKTRIMTGHVSGLMAFPFTVSKIIQLSNDGASGAADLAKVIESDPVISTNLLKICNSVLFAASTRRISSIKDAVIRIGFNETRRIAMSMSVMKLFDSGKGNFGFNRINFWQHCLAAAIVAEQIAKKMGDVNSDEAFLAGMLHDFGVIILDEFFSPVFSKILELTTNTASRFIEVEKEILGISHIDITNTLFKDWNIPESISEGIHGHYSILRQESSLDTPEDKLAFCASMGNLVAKIFSFGAACDQYITPIDNWAFRKAKFPFGFRQKYTEVINKDLMLYQEFLKVGNDNKATFKIAREIQTTWNIGIQNLTDDVFLPAEIYLADQGHTIIHLLENSNEADPAISPEIVLIFTRLATTADQLQEALKTIQGTPVEAGAPAPPPAKILAFIDRQSTLPAAAQCEAISFMYTDFDLRQLDVNITSILDGETIKTTAPKNSACLRPQKTEADEKSQNVQASLQTDALSTSVSNLMGECRQKSVRNTEFRDAETLAITAQLKMEKGDHAEAHWMMQLAELYFEKALQRQELEITDLKIQNLEGSLCPEEKAICDRLLKK
jgi:HD-like signal output (HDOD) protein